jgi:hypothetical protein
MDSCIAHTSKNMGKKFCSENMKEDTIWDQMKLEMHGSTHMAWNPKTQNSMGNKVQGQV